VTVEVGTREEQLVGGLGGFLSEGSGEAVVVEGLARLSGGASRETWAFDARSIDGTTRPMVLQRERAGGGLASRGMVLQAGLLRAASDAGVPVPGLVAVDPDGAALGAPSILMDRVEGETIARRILRDDDYDTARRLLVGQVGAALAAVHRIDPDAVEGLDASDQLQQMTDLLDLLGEPHPAFEIGLRRLRTTRPERGPSGVVHGDFRMGNLIVEAHQPVSEAELRRLLLEECRRQNKPYGLLFDDITGGFTGTRRMTAQSFKVLPVVVYRVFADGRPDELVRGVDVVGTPLTSFSRIIAAGDDPGVFNGTCGAESGGVPVSAVSPSILVSQIEVEKRRREQDRPPILASPLAETTATTR